MANLAMMGIAAAHGEFADLTNIEIMRLSIAGTVTRELTKLHQ